MVDLTMHTAESHISGLTRRNSAGLMKVVECQLGNDHASELLKACGTRVITCRNGAYSIVSTANDQSNPLPASGFLELHTDGLYCGRIPDLGIFYCEDAGEQACGTVLADTRIVIENLREQRLLESFRQLQMVYEFGNLPPIPLPIIADHPLTGEPIIHIGANGYLPTPVFSGEIKHPWSFREIVERMHQLYRLLDDAVVLEHKWKTRDLLIFDNHTFVHCRQNSIIDHHRKLIRLWLAADTQHEGI